MIGVSEHAWNLAQDRLGPQIATAALVLTFDKHCEGRSGLSGRLSARHDPESRGRGAASRAQLLWSIERAGGVRMLIDYGTLAYIANEENFSMVTRNVVLTDTQDQLVQALVASGRYQNVSEAMRAGLRAARTGRGAACRCSRRLCLKVFGRPKTENWPRAAGRMRFAGPLRGHADTLMSRSFRLTRRAEASLIEIAFAGPIERFGTRQADASMSCRIAFPQCDAIWVRVAGS